MPESYYESRIKQHTRSLNSARKKQADEETKAASADGEVSRLQRQLERSSSDSQRSSKQRRITSKRDEASKARGAAAKASQSVSDAQKKLGEAQQKLTEAQATRQRHDHRREQRDQRRAERDRAQAEARRDRKVEGLTSQAAELEEQVREAQRKLAPPEITVLFLASSPEDLEPLRLDKEAREIQKRLRSTEHRDSIKFDARTARQLTDLIEDLNEARPHIVHFSGHGSQRELAFEDANGNARPLGNELLARLLSTTSKRIRLAVFNSCQSATQAKAACEHIDLAIGVSTSVRDELAKTFAAQFYNSLGFGESVAKAFEQAKLQVALAHGDGDHVPQLFAAEGVNPSTVILVDPDGEAPSVAV